MKLGLRIAALLLLAAVFTGCATSQVFYRPYDEVKAGMEKMATPIHTQGKALDSVFGTNAPSNLNPEEIRAAIQARGAAIRAQRVANTNNFATLPIPSSSYTRAIFKEVNAGRKAELYIDEHSSSKLIPITIVKAFPRGSKATTVIVTSHHPRDRAREALRLKQLMKIVPPGQPYKKFVP
jgi:hypothetical protein